MQWEYFRFSPKIDLSVSPVFWHFFISGYLKLFIAPLVRLSAIFSTYALHIQFLKFFKGSSPTMLIAWKLFLIKTRFRLEKMVLTFQEIQRNCILEHFFQFLSIQLIRFFSSTVCLLVLLEEDKRLIFATLTYLGRFLEGYQALSWR